MTQPPRPRPRLRQPPEGSVSIELEVPFHDVDSLQIVWHGHYFKYLEQARTALLRSCGLDIPDVVGMGYAMLVTESRCRHSFPLRYGDRFRVTAWCVEWRQRLRVRYELWNLTHDRRSARGHTVMVTTNLSGKLLYETPEEITHAIQFGVPRAEATAAVGPDPSVDPGRDAQPDPGAEPGRGR